MSYEPHKHSGLALADKMFKVAVTDKRQYVNAEYAHASLTSPVVELPTGPAFHTWSPGACEQFDVVLWKPGPKKKWPDFMEVYHDPYALVVSESVMGAFRDEGVSSYFDHPVTFRLRDTGEVFDGAPSFYAVFPEPLVECQRSEQDRVNLDMPSRVYGDIPMSDSKAAGPMVFTDTSFGKKIVTGTCIHYCNRLFVELAHRERWKGVEFSNVNLPFSAGQHHINPLDRKWPPMWRPLMPHERTLDEWIDFVGAHARDRTLLRPEVRFALSYHGARLVEAAWARRADADPRSRHAAARVIIAATGGVSQGDETECVITEEMEVWADAELGWTDVLHGRKALGLK